ncbi:MAG: hypothetical protein WCP93_01950 [Candidatus Berkelbacteria bacterium]
MIAWLARVGLATLNIAVFFIEEGWIIAMVALLPFWAACLATILLLSLFSITCTYLCEKSELSPTLKIWLEKEKEKEQSQVVMWAKKIAKGLIYASTLIVAVVVSPSTSALMLNQAGVKKNSAYMVDIVYSGISGFIWCIIYGLGINLVKLGYDFFKHLIGGN